MAKPKSFDSHYIEIYEHHTKNFDDNVLPKLAEKLTTALNIQNLLDDPLFNKGNGIQVKASIIAQADIQRAAIIAQARIDYVEVNTRLEL